MKLRNYQQEAYENIISCLSNGAKSALVVCPTGTGKSVILSHVAHNWPRGRVLVIDHREELTFQNADKIAKITGEYPDIEMAELRAKSHTLMSRSNVVVSSIQTQNSGKFCKECDGEGCHLCVDGMVRRMQKISPHDCGLLIVDEAHHATAKSYRRLIRYYQRNPNMRVLGVTATPDRTDEVALGNIFESVAYEYGLTDAIDDGWLVPIKQEFIHCEGLDFSHVRKTAGELNIGDLEDVLTEESPLQQVVLPTIEIAGDRPTLVFASSVKHAEMMAAIANRVKPGASICITGKTPRDERRDLLKRYANGEFQYLFGMGCFTEGFDEPRISVVAMARPTLSRSLYAQMVGRATRPITPPTAETAAERRATIAASIKPEMTVLDFCGNSGKHKLVSTADLLGGQYEDEVITRATERAKSSPREPIDMEIILAAEQSKLEEERKRAKVVAKATYSRRSVDAFDLLDVAPAREPGWHKGRKPTRKMIDMLARAGVPNPARMSFWDAKIMIGTICERRDKGLCTFKQAKLLARYGEDPGVTFDKASQLITAIKNRGWR